MELLILLAVLAIIAIVGAVGAFFGDFALLGMFGFLLIFTGVFIFSEGIDYTTGINETSVSFTDMTNTTQTNTTQIFDKTTYTGIGQLGISIMTMMSGVAVLFLIVMLMLFPKS